MSSGSRAASSANVIHGECLPAVPKRLVPPASSTSVGTQLPAAMSGSTHSMHATVGRLAAVRARTPTASMRPCSSWVSARPRSSTPSAAATRAMSRQMSSSALGSSETIFGREPTIWHTAASTSLVDTAHTSHCDWVMMTSGRSASSPAASTR